MEVEVSGAEWSQFCCLRKYLFRARIVLSASPVLEAEDGVEEGVESAGQVIKDTGEVEEILVDSSEELRSFEVDVAQPLEVERSPGYKEEKDDTC